MYKCIKCGNSEYEKDVFRASGAGVSRLFDVQNKKFATISCSKCGYTEIYKEKSSTLGNIADFLFSN